MHLWYELHFICDTGEFYSILQMSFNRLDINNKGLGLAHKGLQRTFKIFLLIEDFVLNKRYMVILFHILPYFEYISNVHSQFTLKIHTSYLMTVVTSYNSNPLFTNFFFSNISWLMFSRHTAYHIDKSHNANKMSDIMIYKIHWLIDAMTDVTKQIAFTSAKLVDVPIHQ